MITFADIDECQTNNGDCIQNCTNTDGSRICTCSAGYVLNVDLVSCNGEWVKRQEKAYRGKSYLL